MGHVKRSKRILVNMYTFGSENHLNAFFYFCKFVGLVNFYSTIHCTSKIVRINTIWVYYLTIKVV